MSTALQTLLAAALTWVAVVAAASFMATACYGSFGRLAAQAPAAARGIALFIYGLLPLLIGTLVVCLLNFAALYSVFLPEHCHAGNCAPHAPEFATSAAQGVAAVAALLTTLVAVLWLPVGQLARGLRRSRLTAKLGRPLDTDARDDGQRYRVIDSDHVLAWCDGLWLPTVYVSRGLLEQVSAAELAVVLAHEEAHARRHDNLARLILDWATRLWPVEARQRISQDFAAAAEQACDALAAKQVNSAEQVAHIIERLGPGAAGSLELRTTHWHTGVVAARVAALRASHPPLAPAALAPWLALFALWLAESYAFTLAAHPLLEWLGG